MYKDLLPIGSIVILKGGEVKMMIVGRIVTNGEAKEIFDYVACIYPRGIVDSSNLYFFNRDDIDDIYFIGFQDRDELIFRQGVLDTLGELEIKDGQIIPKE